MSEEIEYPSKERERAKVNVKVSAEVNTYLHDLYNQIQYEFCEQYEDEIKYLQQKVEQLENENEYLKMSNPEQNMEHFRIVNENKRKIDMLRKEKKKKEKEVNEYQKELEKADSITQSCIFQGKQESKISFRNCLNRLEQLENIRKEAIEYVKNDSYFDGSGICANDLLKILNKGSEDNE